MQNKTKLNQYMNTFYKDNHVNDFVCLIQCMLLEFFVHFTHLSKKKLCMIKYMNKVG